MITKIMDFAAHLEKKKILIHLVSACFARPHTVMLMLLDQNF